MNQTSAPSPPSANARCFSVFGLRYVGSVAAGCLAAKGCRVIGVDVHPEKVRRLNAGEPPIYEPGLAERIGEGVASGRLSATADVAAAIAGSDVSLVCVGTPCGADGAIDLGFVEAVTAEIAAAVKQKGEPHWIVYRSTMLPGSTRRFAAEIGEATGGVPGVRVAFFPEFLRQGTAIEDYESPSLSVIGVEGEAVPGDELGELIEPDTSIVSFEEAELLKYACNAFHATKVAFANEIGRIGKRFGLDSGRVMEALCRDVRLNISPYYMRPGNPFGGSCLPKDVSALTVLAAGAGAEIPLLNHLLASNTAHRKHLLDLVEASGQREVVVLGLAFKPGTDDLRGSALLRIAAELASAGYALRIYEPLLDVDRLVGAARRTVDEILPGLAGLMRRDLGEAVGERGVLLASNRCAPIGDLERVVTPGHHVIDVTGWGELASLPSTYEGICW